MNTKITSRTPTRIDLAGGTIDLWPLYLFFEKSLTINLGIDLFAQAELEEVSDSGRVTLEAQDQGVKETYSWDKLDLKSFPPALQIHGRLLKSFVDRAPSHRGREIVLRSKAKSPAGAGLGGSSTLAIAMAGAINQWTGLRMDHEALIHWVKDVETQILGIPAGVQDYYGAAYGGLQTLHWRVGQMERKAWPEKLARDLSDRLILFYSGKSRNSGLNNWAMYKSLIDRESQVLSAFEGIVAATLELEAALEKSDFASVVSAIDREWQARKKLSDQISTPEIDEALKRASVAGKFAAKICGAGGGGCFFIFLEDPNNRSQVIQKVEKDGIQTLPFTPSMTGLEVKETNG